VTGPSLLPRAVSGAGSRWLMEPCVPCRSRSARAVFHAVSAGVKRLRPWTHQFNFRPTKATRRTR